MGPLAVPRLLLKSTANVASLCIPCNAPRTSSVAFSTRVFSGMVVLGFPARAREGRVRREADRRRLVLRMNSLYAVSRISFLQVCGISRH
jgi:hypothetical protein